MATIELTSNNNLEEKTSNLTFTTNENLEELKKEASLWANDFYHNTIEKKKILESLKDNFIYAITESWSVQKQIRMYVLPIAIAASFFLLPAASPVLPILIATYLALQISRFNIKPVLSLLSERYGIPYKATKETKALFKKKAILELTKKRTDKLIDKKINDLNQEHVNATKLVSRLKQDYPDKKKLIQKYNTKINNFNAQIKNAKEFKLKTSNENSKLIDEHNGKLDEKPYKEQRWMSSKTKKIEKYFDKLNGVESSYTEPSISKDPPETKTFSYQKENQNPLLLKKEAPKLDSNIPSYKNNEQSSFPKEFHNNMTVPLNASERLNKKDKLEQNKNTLITQTNHVPKPPKPANGLSR